VKPATPSSKTPSQSTTPRPAARTRAS
jgi:hypothetical protein